MGGVRAGTAMYSRHARNGSSRPKFPVPVPGQEALRSTYVSQRAESKAATVNTSD